MTTFSDVSGSVLKLISITIRLLFIITMSAPTYRVYRVRVYCAIAQWFEVSLLC